MIWQRLLTLFSGADVYSVTLIVAAFMAGLGFGNLAGGHLADRLSPAGRLFAFATAEAAIAVFAFASVPLLYSGLYLHLGPRALSSPALALVLFTTLLWPTFFMGLSLPLLARAVTDRAERAGPRIGALYGWNTAGAAVGAIATVWGLVRAFGFAGSIRVGAWINLACAGLALGLALAPRRAGRAHEEPPPAEPERASGASPAATPTGASIPLAGFHGWLLIYGLSGFVALSLEIVWFRVLGTLLKSNSFTFATLLSVYLAGLALGALVGSRVAARVRRPGLGFLAAQAGVGLYAGLSLAAFVAGLGRLDVLEPVWRHVAGGDPLDLSESVRAVARWLLRAGAVAPHTTDLASRFAALYVVVPLALVGPPTVLMGLSFPLLQRAVQTDIARLGRRVGWLQTANIAGSTLGAALTGVALLDRLGTAATLRLLVLLSGLFLVLGARTASRPGGRRWAALTAAIAAVGFVALASPGADRLWAALHGASPAAFAHAEDGSGIIALREETVDGRPVTQMLIAGLAESQLPYGGYHSLLGLLPSLMHPAPADLAVIGLGSGETLHGIAGRPETERIVCVEIVSAQQVALRRHARRRRDPGLLALLADGRIRVLSGDGRSFLMRGAARYDLIEADALRPASAFSGNLYSAEYFDLVRRRLKPGGFAVTWCPTERVRRTFLRVFPHAFELRDVLVGSDAPIAFDPERLRARLRDPFTAAHFRRARIDAELLLAEALQRAPRSWGPGSPRDGGEDLNTDLFPRDEYLVGRPFLPFGAGALPRAGALYSSPPRKAASSRQ